MNRLLDYATRSGIIGGVASLFALLFIDDSLRYPIVPYILLCGTLVVLISALVIVTILILKK